MTLTTIIKGLQLVIKECDLAVNDSILFEQAIKIYISNKIGESKKENIKSMKDINKPIQAKSNEPEAQNKGVLATDKQISFLKKNRIPFDESITKQEASIRINNLIKLMGGK